MILASADRDVRAFAAELGSDAAVAERVGLILDELIEAAEARSERPFWAVSNPNGYPGPRTHGALAGAWFHGALCAAVWRDREASPPVRPVGAGALMEAVQAFEAESDETGDSRATLSRYGLVRATLQPEFGALAPQRAVIAVCSELGARTLRVATCSACSQSTARSSCSTHLIASRGTPGHRRRTSSAAWRRTGCIAQRWTSA